MASNNSTDARLVKNNLRSMIGYRYESDHDFYEQLKKAIGYTGATYDGVCERLIELMDDYAHCDRHRGIRNRHGSGREPHAGAEQRLLEAYPATWESWQEADRKCQSTS